MATLVTGAAGFIGFHVIRALRARGDEVVGVDDLNPYYDPKLKEARLAAFEGDAGFHFTRADVSDREALFALVDAHPEITRVVHLAAQAGVRYSLENPYVYVDANVMGQLVMLEACRRLPRMEHLVYASSSSVYGGNRELPFSVDDRVDHPVSLYAATKRAGELIGHVYAHLYQVPSTGLRFFTVYGPWGRPDMAAWIFTRAIFEGRPLVLYNEGRMRRDFTYVDDIVAGTLAALDRPPSGSAPHRLFNLGNHRSEELRHFVEVLEEACGRKAEIELAPLQPGDVPETYADIEAARMELGFDPATPIDIGLPRFVTWYRSYHHLD